MSINVLRTRRGSLVPEGLPRRRVTALFDSWTDAKRAKRSLTRAGFDEPAVLLWTHANITHYLNPSQPRRGFVARMRSLLMWDERSALKQYARQTTSGRILMMVPARCAAQVDTARTVSGRFGGHDMRFFGKWTIWELGDGPDLYQAPDGIGDESTLREAAPHNWIPVASS